MSQRTPHPAKSLFSCPQPANFEQPAKPSISLMLDRLVHQPNRDDLIYFLNTENPDDLRALFQKANSVRHDKVGDDIYLRAILEISNTCKRSCLYCGINRNVTNITRYRMSFDEILLATKAIYAKGYRTIVIQAAEDPAHSPAFIADLIRTIRSENPDLAITLSLGEYDKKTYKLWRNAGADRYLLKFETSDPLLYKKLNPGMTLSHRITCLRNLHALGYQTGSGVILGLPNQSISSIADDILLFKKLQIVMIGCGPYIPVPALAPTSTSTQRITLSIKVLALNRLVNTNAHLPATTALSTLGEQQTRLLALNSGANIIMPNETPAQYRNLYSIYPNKKRTEASSDTNFISEITASVQTIGRQINLTRGDALQPSTHTKKNQNQ